MTTPPRQLAGGLARAEQRDEAWRQHTQAIQDLPLHDHLPTLARQLIRELQNLKGQRLDGFLQAIRALTRVTTCQASVSTPQALQYLLGLAGQHSPGAPEHIPLNRTEADLAEWLMLAAPDQPLNSTCYDPIGDDHAH